MAQGMPLPAHTLWPSCCKGRLRAADKVIVKEMLQFGNLHLRVDYQKQPPEWREPLQLDYN
jgi:hypothetical protein